jgi:DNA (cytosine-5)-methyltransferase 1
MSESDAKGWSPVDAAPTVTHWPRDRSDTGTDVVIAFSANMSKPDARCDGTNPTLKVGSSNGIGGVAVAHALTKRHDSSEDGTGRGVPLVTVAYSVSPGHCGSSETKDDIYITAQTTSRTIDTTGGDPERKQGGTVVVQEMVDALFFQEASSNNQRAPDLGRMQVIVDVAETILSRDYKGPNCDRDRLNGKLIAAGMHVRRLTPASANASKASPTIGRWSPTETNPPPTGPRYKALGNSMAVNCMRWIGYRIEANR